MIIDRTADQTMLYLPCTMIFSVDLAHYRVSRAKDWISVDWDTICFNYYIQWHKNKFLSLLCLHLFVGQHHFKAEYIITRGNLFCITDPPISYKIDSFFQLYAPVEIAYINYLY